jgi:hypothetical protein
LEEVWSFGEGQMVRLNRTFGVHDPYIHDAEISGICRSDSGVDESGDFVEHWSLPPSFSFVHRSTASANAESRFKFLSTILRICLLGFQLVGIELGIR